MTRIKIKEQDQIEQLKRFISFRLGKELGLGTLVFDPAGDNLILILDFAERFFGKDARDELFEFLEPYHKSRVLRTIHDEGVKQRLWIAASELARRKKKKKNAEEEEEEDEFSDDIFGMFEGGEE